MKKLQILTTTLIIVLFTLNQAYSQEKYAVIITGDYAATSGTWAVANGGGRSAMEEFWNDTYLMWELLHDKGYEYENIYVLFADGEDYIFEDQDDRYKASKYNQFSVTDLAATKANVLEVLTGLADGSNEYPMLTEDDFLYLFTFDHGYYTTGVSWDQGVRHTLLCLLGYDWTTPIEDWDEANSIADFEIQSLLGNINANKKLVVMQQCYSGGFIPYLADPNTVICTAASELKAANTTDQYYYDDIDFPGDSEPGDAYIVLDEDEVYAGSNHQYIHGEFDLHLLNSLSGKTPDGLDTYVVPGYQDFPLSDADLNQDDIVSISEGFQWVLDFDSRMRAPLISGKDYDDPQLSPTSGLAEYTSLEYPTLMFENIGPLEGITVEHRGIIGITKDVHINSTNQLTFLNDADVYLLNEAKLFVDAGASLILEDNVSIFAMNENNKIEVNGNLLVGNNVIFSSEVEYPLEIKLKNTSAQTTFSNTTFTNCEIHSYVNKLTLNGSTFTDCDMVYSYFGELDFNNTSFRNTGLYLENGNHNSDDVSINECTFTTNQYLLGICIWDYDKISITNNTIDGYYDGIQIMQTGTNPFVNLIWKNAISYCTNAGIVTFNSEVSIIQNYIHNNKDGIRLLNNSNVRINGDPGATKESELNRIIDNDRYELYASSGSFPWYFRFNAIKDADNSGNPTDPHIYYDPSGSFLNLDVSYNCWDGSFDPVNDLYPLGSYTHLPMWCPPGSGHKNSELALEEFMDGIDHLENQEYTDAKPAFETVVEQYPQTQYASAAMKELFGLEKFVDNDYATLKQFYQTNDSIQADSVLTKLAVFLSNKCEIELENWQTAIDDFEDIIENPDSPQDSIFAIIDLGYTYFLMENSGQKSSAQGSLLQHKPESITTFSAKRDTLLALLPFKTKLQENETKSDNLKPGSLSQNIPNPFSGTTTVFYSLEKSSDISLKVFNHLGKTVKQLNFVSQKEGENKVELILSGLPTGIYFYSLFVNGQLTDTKKMVVK